MCMESKHFRLQFKIRDVRNVCLVHILVHHFCLTCQSWKELDKKDYHVHVMYDVDFLLEFCLDFLASLGKG